MNVIRLLGLDATEITGTMLLIVAIVIFVFPYINWKVNHAWKRDEGEKTGFFEIWRPMVLISFVMALLLALFFFLSDDILTFLLNPEEAPAWIQSIDNFFKNQVES